jgi:tetratricopeptide (TPR) repeat protein
VALAVRLVHTWQIRSAPFFDLLMGDAQGYDDWARRIAGGSWLGSDVFYQAPLYPYFLAVIYATAGRHLLLVRVVQAFIGSGACVLLGVAVWRLFSKRAGLVAGLALALYAPAIFFEGLIQKSVLDVFFICLILRLAASIIRAPDRQRLWLGLGAATGGLALTRENALVFVVVILAWAVVGVRQGSDPRLAGVRRGSDPVYVLLGLALVLMPVAGRNYLVGGGFYLTTSQFGPNFFIGNNPKADGTYRALRPGRGAPEFERADATALAEAAVGHTLTPGEVSSYWTDRALAFIFGQPARWARLEGRKAVLVVNAAEMMDTEDQDTYAEWSWPLRLGGWIGHFGFLVPLALLGAWIVWPERARLWPFYAMTVAYMGSLLLFYVFARYRFPLVPLLLLFAAPGVVALPAFARSATNRERFGALAVVVIALVVSNWPIVEPGVPQAITENNLGRFLQGERRFDEAAVHYQRSIALSPAFTPAYTNIGLLLAEQGKPDEALAAYLRAIQAEPTYAETYYHLGVALQERGDHEHAIERLREFIRLTPDASNITPANNLVGISLLALGRLDEALTTFRQSAATEPGNAEARRGLGDVLLKQRRFDEAVRELQEAVRLAPQSAAALHSLGLAFALQNQDTKAIDPFTRAADLDPSNAAFRQDVGTAQAATGRLDDAVASYRRALELSPDSASIHSTLGAALAALGKRDEALPHLRRALELDPTNPEIRRDVDAALRIGR